MEEVNILPTTLYKFRSPGDLHERALRLIEREQKSKSWENLSTSHELHKKPEFAEFRNWISSCIEQVRQKLNYNCRELEVTQMVGAVTPPSQTHHPHDHANSVVAGVWYLNEVSGGDTLFFDVNRWHQSPVRLDPKRPNSTDRHGSHGHFGFRFYEWMDYDGAGQLIPRNADYNPFVVSKFSPSAGVLILFPAWLLHAVTPNLSQETRYSIAVNSFPRDFGYGSHRVSW